jgi:alpha 1,3-glucosidase
MEHFRKKPEPPAPKTEGSEEQTVVEAPNPRAWFEGDKEDDLWEETFGTWTDSKPKGMFSSH